MPSRAAHHDGPQAIRGPPKPVFTRSETHLGGLIMWLPPRDGLETHAELPEGCYDHPVVILSPQASPPDDYVVVLIVTSFDETDIRDRFPRDRDAALRRAYLPIHPASNPDVETVLHLADGAELSKKSYVNTRKKHTVPLRIIRPYVGHGPAAAEQYILTRESYLALARHARFDTYLPATVREPGPLLAELPPAERLGLEPPVSHGTMAVAKAPTPPLSPILRDTSPYTTPALRSYPPAERLGPAPPISYGTIPVARAAPPPPLPHLTRDDFLRTTTTPALRPYHYPSRQSQHDATPLPRFHYSQPTARYRAGATLWPDGSGLPSGRVGPLLPFPRKLLLYAIVVCLYCGGLWAGWAYRAEIGAALLAGVRWVGAGALRLVKSVVGGLGRAVVWLVLWLVEVGKRAGLKVWEWLRGGHGGRVGQALW